MVKSMPSMIATRAAARAALLVAVILLPGCSLLTIKSPEIPLTPREQEARLLTRDYAAHFVTTMTHALDEVPHGEGDAELRARALRLKLGAVSEITRASTGLSPMASLIDTWAFAVQLRDYLTTGAGAELLGSAQPDVRLTVARLAEEADQLAHKVAGPDYARYQSFVAGYTDRNPIVSADCARPSVLASWVAVEGDTSPLRAEGTVSQALGDVSDRVRIYSERVPPLSLWQAELALDRAGFDQTSYRNALRDFDAQLAHISKLADTSPELVHEALADLRESLRLSEDRLDLAWQQMLRTVHGEREALAANIAAERTNATAAFDVERARIAEDAGKIAAQAVDTSWHELRKLIREALALLIVLALVMLGLPFAAGYLVGRRRAPRPPAGVT
jgi:hypothetical protein